LIAHDARLVDEWVTGIGLRSEELRRIRDTGDDSISDLAEVVSVSRPTV
jgi:predicted transcriptional regulator